jgi:phosphonate transport system substrate-binding protein
VRSLTVKLVLVVALVALLGVGLSTSLGGAAQQAQVGTKERPIIWLLPPSVLPATIEETGKAIAEDLYEMTGYYIKYVVAASYAALNEAMIAAREDTMACPTTEQYAQITMANPKVHARLAAVRRGYAYYFASIYAFREKGYDSIEDLNGTIWIYNDPGSTSGYVIPKKAFDKLGLTFAGTVESGGHTASVIALLEGQGDFATGYGSPPVPPASLEEALKAVGFRWEYGMDPELWVWDRWRNDLWPEAIRGVVKDVRWAVAAATTAYGSYWDIVKKVGIVATLGPMPNDSLSFCQDFPKDVEDKIVQAVIQHIRSPEGKKLWSNPNFYEWDDVMEIDDSFYDCYRELVGYPIPEGRSCKH